jgi:hypothetical protein
VTSTVDARFWAKVDKNGPFHPVLKTRCWIWTAYLRPNGYGGFRWHDGDKWVMAYAHRVVWTITGKPLKKGQQSLHLCDNPACVNYQDHLIKGTQTDNLFHAAKQGHMSRDVRGQKNPRARLTPAQVLAIRLAHPRDAKGRRIKVRGLALVLAQKYGTTVHYIRRLWADDLWT